MTAPLRRTRFAILITTLAALLVGGQAAFGPSGARAAGPVPAQRISDQLLDPAAHARVTYEGSVNIASFQQDALLTVGDLQYTAWYREDGVVAVSRRTLPEGTWSSLELDGRLAANDSHNTISLAVSPGDGRLHIALGTHTGAQLYIRSQPGIAAAAWTSRAFESVRSLPFSNPGGPGNTGLWTYPQFEVNDGQLLLTYREGITNNGEQALARYDGDAAGTWTYLGRFTDATGTWTGPYGSSSSRYSYLHGFGTNPLTGDLEISFSWRERSGWCNGGGLGNHDLGYARSSDGGLTWVDNAGQVIGRTGTSDRISVTDPHVVVPISINRGLINQEAQTFDTEGQVHVMTSQFNDADLAAIGGCHTSTYSQREQYAKPFHHWRDAQGTWHTMELPFYNNSAGRTKLLFDAQDDAWLVLPDGRVATATAASQWSDWQLAFEDPAVDPLAEMVVDRTRLKRDGVLSLAYLQVGDGVRGEFRVADLDTGASATGDDAARDTTPQATPADNTGSLVVYPIATASSNQPGYPATLAVDRNPATFWVSGGSAEGQGPQPSRPQTLTVVFGEDASTTRAIGTVTVTPRVGFGPRNLQIEALVDGVWQGLGSYAMPNAATTFDTPDVRAAQLRLVITAAYDNARPPTAARNVQVAEVAITAPVDTTAPTTAASFDDAGGLTQRPVTVTLAATDDWSGVAQTRYTVDGGPEQVYEGPFEVSGAGSHPVRFWSTDGAGNVEVAQAVTVTLAAPDGATTAPGQGFLSADNGHDNGLLDGEYTVKMDLWWGQNASSFELYENGQLVDRLALSPRTPQRQTASTAITGRVNGTYEYTGVLVNSAGQRATTSVTVTVRDAAPGRPVLSSDNWDGDGTYRITADMWWGTNATSWRLLEDGVEVRSGQLTAATPRAQSVRVDLSGRSVGSHEYVVEFTNTLGTTASAPHTVQVSR